MAVNLAVYHQPLSPYYTGGQSFDVSRTMAVALAGNLVSPARGLFIFCPLVVLSVAGVVVRWRAGELTAFWKALAVIPILHWIVVSAFKHWWGGDSYGPRFFTDLMPIFAVLALPAVEVLARWVAGWRHPPSKDGSVAHPVAEAGAGAATTPMRPWRGVVMGLTVAALVWSVGVNAEGAILRSAWVLEQCPHRRGHPSVQAVGLERSPVRPGRSHPDLGTRSECGIHPRRGGSARLCAGTAPSEALASPRGRHRSEPGSDGPGDRRPSPGSGRLGPGSAPHAPAG